MTSLKFGLSLAGVGGRGMAALARAARRAEELGFADLWVGEHVAFHSPTHDGITVMTAVAAVTERIRVGTSIVLLPLKHPVLVCKAATTLDHLSGGRFSFGIGVGGDYPKEFDAVGVPMRERGARTNESLEIIKRLWTEDNVTYHGRFFRLEDVTLKPRAVQQPHPPILVAGRRGSLARTARYGDGWMPYMLTPQMYREWWEAIAEAASARGRDPGRIERTLYIQVTPGKTREAAERDVAATLGARFNTDMSDRVKRYSVYGTPEQCAERLLEYAEVGAEHFILSPSAPQPEVAETFPELIAYEIIPRVFKGR